MFDKVANHKMIINADTCPEIPKGGCRAVRMSKAVQEFGWKTWHSPSRMCLSLLRSNEAILGEMPDDSIKY